MNHLRKPTKPSSITCELICDKWLPMKEIFNCENIWSKEIKAWELWFLTIITLQYHPCTINLLPQNFYKHGTINPTTSNISTLLPAPLFYIYQWHFSKECVLILREALPYSMTYKDQLLLKCTRQWMANQHQGEFTFYWTEKSRLTKADAYHL